MYPLLLDFNCDFDRKNDNPLSFVIENICDSVVKNGEFMGKSIKEALHSFGNDAFGENGIDTVVFRPLNEKTKLLKTINEISFDSESLDDATIFPFGVVNDVMKTNELTASLFSLDGKAGMMEEKSFLLIFVIENDCLVSDFDSTMKVNCGGLVFVPAKTRVEITGEAKMILVHC